MTISKKTNVLFVVESVPAVVAIFFLLAKLPAIASVPIIGRNLANNITNPRVIFKNGVLASKPANAEPLLPPADEKAYKSSENREHHYYLSYLPHLVL